VIDGLWTLEFSAPRLSGAGVAVFADGRVLGGDGGYYYAGDYKVNGDGIEATIDVVRFERNSISVFGDIPRFQLVVSGNVEGSELRAKGHMVQLPDLHIQIHGRKKVDM
jgi:hypothetical protein